MKGRKPKARKAGDESLPIVRPVAAPPGALAPPPSLPTEGVPVWEQAVAELGELLHAAHLPLVEQLVVAAVRHRQAQAILARDGLLTETASGELRTHPMARLERDSAMLYARLCDQLGLSPSARMRLGLMQAVGQSLLAQIAERVDEHVAGRR